MPGYLLLSCLRYGGCHSVQGRSLCTLPALIVLCHIHTILERSGEKGLLQSYFWMKHSSRSNRQKYCVHVEWEGRTVCGVQHLGALLEVALWTCRLVCIYCLFTHYRSFLMYFLTAYPVQTRPRLQGGLEFDDKKKIPSWESGSYSGWKNVQCLNMWKPQLSLGSLTVKSPVGNNGNEIRFYGTWTSHSIEDYNIQQSQNIFLLEGWFIKGCMNWWKVNVRSIIFYSVYSFAVGPLMCIFLIYHVFLSSICAKLKKNHDIKGKDCSIKDNHAAVVWAPMHVHTP